MPAPGRPCLPAGALRRDKGEDIAMTTAQYRAANPSNPTIAGNRVEQDARAIRQQEAQQWS